MLHYRAMYSTFPVRAGRAFNLNVYNKSTRAQRAQAEDVAHEDYRAIARFQYRSKPAELLSGAFQARSLHARHHEDSPQAELGHKKNRPCPPHERHGNHRIHPRRRARSAGTLRGSCARRAREGYRRAVHDSARQVGRDRGRRAPPRPLPLWRKTSQGRKEVLEIYERSEL